MKIIVFSDSHGRTLPVIAGIDSEKPDMLLFLGDGAKDMAKIKSQFPDIPLTAVCGNCDMSPTLQNVEILTVDGVRIFMTHGHLYRVKGGNLYALAEAADNADCSLALYGHTHTARVETVGRVTTLNPGSCGGAGPSFAIVTTDGAGGFSLRIAEL